MAIYPIGIVGESFMNLNGRSRQAEIKRCQQGEAVMLEREPHNPHDPQCVKVISSRGVQIGNISRDDGWIAERLDRGSFVDATIKSILTGESGKVGVVLRLRTSADDAAFDAPAKGCAGSIAAIGLVGLLLVASPLHSREKGAVGKDMSLLCGGQAACIARQEDALDRYLKITVLFEAPTPVMERCMRAGKRIDLARPLIDWTRSEQCMRQWSKGRKWVFPKAGRPKR